MQNSPAGHRDTGPMSTRKIVAIAFGAVLAAAVLVASGWLIRVMSTAGEDGAAPPAWISTSPSLPSNRPDQAAALTDLYRSVQDADDRIQLLAVRAAADPQSDTPYDDLVGAQMICNDNVDEYNSMAAGAPRVPDGFPTSIGKSPDTDCEPDNPPSPAPEPSA